MRIVDYAFEIVGKLSRNVAGAVGGDGADRRTVDKRTAAQN
jgi:hypothetical protein